MKKLFVLFSLCAIALSSCIVDHSYKQEFVLKNDSSHEIAITVPPDSRNNRHNAKSLSLAQGESATWFTCFSVDESTEIYFAYTVMYDGSVSIEYDGRVDSSKGFMYSHLNWQYESLNNKGECRYTYTFTDAEYEAVLAAQE